MPTDAAIPQLIRCCLSCNIMCAGGWCNLPINVHSACSCMNYMKHINTRQCGWAVRDPQPAQEQSATNCTIQSFTCRLSVDTCLYCLVLPIPVHKGQPQLAMGFSIDPVAEVAAPMAHQGGGCTRTAVHPIRRVSTPCW
jgi:hypothetical protein